MSKFNELYGYLSDWQTPHLFVIAEVLYSIKEGLDTHNQQMQEMTAKLDELIELNKKQTSRDQD